MKHLLTVALLLVVGPAWAVDQICVNASQVEPVDCRVDPCFICTDAVAMTYHCQAVVDGALQVFSPVAELTAIPLSLAPKLPGETTEIMASCNDGAVVTNPKAITVLPPELVPPPPTGCADVTVGRVATGVEICACGDCQIALDGAPGAPGVCTPELCLLPDHDHPFSGTTELSQ